MSSKNALVTTTEKKFKEGINDMVTKPNMAKEAITLPIEKIVLTQSKKKKPSIKKKIHPAAINLTKINH